MATFSDVVSYLENNYNNLQNIENKALSFKIDTSGNRKQLIIITLEKDTFNFGEEWIKIVSPIGDLIDDEVEQAFNFVNKFVIGGLLKISDCYYTSSVFKLSNLELNDLKDFIDVIGSTADKLEDKIFDGFDPDNED